MTKRNKEELPDYTVADMNVDGMPWNSRRPWHLLPGDPAKRKHPLSSDPREEENPFLAQNQDPITPKERRGMIWLALKTALCVALIFGGGAFVFILFCVYVWLK